MHSQRAQTIVLSRVNYGEADKIVTALSHTGDKLSLIAKGVRKPKSKLVAGAELFCVADVCYVQGRGSMATLTSARVVSQHTKFLHDLNKVSLAYEALGQVNKHIEDTDGAEHFGLLKTFLSVLESDLPAAVCEAWMWLQLLHLGGHGLRLDVQTNGAAFSESCRYGFDAENGGFCESVTGVYGAEHIKFVKIANSHAPEVLLRITNAEQYASDLAPTFKHFAIGAS